MAMDEDMLSVDRTVDRIVSVVVGILALGVFLSTFNSSWFPIDDPDEAVTVLVPRVILICLIGLSVILFVRSITSDAKTPVAEIVHWRHRASWSRLLKALGVVLAVCLLLRPLGFLIAMPPAIVILALVMGYRSWRSLIAVAVLAPAIAWYLIVDVAELSLPPGPILQMLGLY
ncbi:MAG: tripartite tricarboxylate transporter TctB family protein [Pseudomonadota bacterium]